MRPSRVEKGLLPPLPVPLPSSQRYPNVDPTSGLLLHWHPPKLGRERARDLEN